MASPSVEISRIDYNTALGTVSMVWNGTAAFRDGITGKLKTKKMEKEKSGKVSI